MTTKIDYENAVTHLHSSFKNPYAVPSDGTPCGDKSTHRKFSFSRDKITCPGCLKILEEYDRQMKVLDELTELSQKMELY